MAGSDQRAGEFLSWPVTNGHGMEDRAGGRGLGG